MPSEKMCWMRSFGGAECVLQHLKLAADPPPIAPARLRQDAFAWASA